METLSTKIKRTGKGFGDHGNQFLIDTKQAGKSFMGFVQGEAKDWGTYLKDRYQNIEAQGREVLQPEGESPRDNVWAQIDGLIGKLRRRELEAAATDEPEVDAEESDEVAEEAEVDILDGADETEFEEVDESEIDEDEVEEKE